MTITILATLLTYMINPELKNILDMVENKSPDQLKEATGIKEVWAYVVNNGFAVPFQMFILAFIPIQFLYLLNIISTSVLPGILFGVVLRMDSTKGFEIIISAMAYYVVEIFALCLFAAILFELNQVVRMTIKNIFKRHKNRILFFGKLLNTIKVYVTLFLPLIILAAFLETYISDMILHFIQK